MTQAFGMEDSCHRDSIMNIIMKQIRKSPSNMTGVIFHGATNCYCESCLRHSGEKLSLRHGESVEAGYLPKPFNILQNYFPALNFYKPLFTKIG
jgi:hypothetical protein